MEKGKTIGAKSERERDWLAAIELYYKDYDKVDQTERGLAYEKAMEALMEKYPDDPEAAVFYALALNETALPSDKTYAKQLKAGAILEKLAAKLPDHPGVLHYLIHTYDYPPLAQRGLDAANRYAEVAPAAQHAQHMPSHTYSMLGMWTQSVASNTKSRAVAQGQAAKLWPGATHPGEPHHLDFMEYALLQMGQEGPAKQLRDDSNAIKKLGFEYLASYTALAAVPARFALERQAWKEAAALEPRGSKFPQAEAITYFARAMGSARSGDLAAAERDVDKLKELRAALENASQSYWATQVEIQMLAASAWIAQAKGENETALKLMRDGGGSGGQQRKAHRDGEPALPDARTAGRSAARTATAGTSTNGVRDFAGIDAQPAARLVRRSQGREGHKSAEKAAEYFRKLAEMTKDADADRVEISEAKASLIQQ